MTFWKQRAIEPEPLRLRFAPQLDITTYELAVICAKCDPHREVAFKPDVWEQIEPSIKRHFK